VGKAHGTKIKVEHFSGFGGEMTLEDLYRLLRSSHVQTQGIVDTLQEPLVVLDKALCVVNANPAFYRTFSTEQEETLGQSLFELGDGQWNIPELRHLLGEVVPKAVAVVGYEVTRTFPNIGRRIMTVSARQLFHADNNSTQMLVVFEDVTERKKSDAAKDLLVAETRHRMKNLMAIVQAVARQTKAAGRTGEEFRDVLLARFEAVLNAQAFIFSQGSTADLGSLIMQSLQPAADARAMIVSGPGVKLSEHQVLPVAMILHELATNSLKYGALSTESGIVHIGWNTEQTDARTRLSLNWHEEGGPPVKPPNQQGFGTKLIEHTCKAEGGDGRIDFDPAGIRAQITLLLAE
jgi:PAS domain S-box-containing protein